MLDEQRQKSKQELFGMNLKCARIMKGIDQETLAQNIGISAEELALVEEGKSLLTAGQCFCAIYLLEVGVADLFQPNFGVFSDHKKIAPSAHSS